MQVSVVLFAGLILVIIVLVGYIIGNHAKSVYNHLDDVLKKANEINNKEELNKLLNEVKKYAIKNCYHHHLMCHAYSVYNYIKGKLSTID